MIGRKSSIRSILFFAIIVVQLHFIETVVAESKAKGWHWYNETYEVNKKKDTKKKRRDNEEQTQKRTKYKINENTATEQIIILRKIVDEAKAKAVLYPTVENLRDYIMLQNYVVNQATIFSQVWQKALLEYPEIDFTIAHPTQNAMQSIVLDEKIKKEEEAVRMYSKSYGLFFFYRGDNKLDQMLSETVQNFSNTYNISLIAIAVDGKVLAIFKDGKINEGQAEKLGIKYFPALILIDPNTQKSAPLHYGFISYTGLRARFLQIATDFKNGE